MTQRLLPASTALPVWRRCGIRTLESRLQAASAKPLMGAIGLPALALNALNDPFVPAHSLPSTQDVSPSVTLWQPSHGGHVGFAQGGMPGHVHALPDAVGGWLMDAVGQTLERQERIHG